LGVALYFTWDCALGLGVVKDDVPPEVSAAIKKRIILAEGMCAVGAALCVFSPYLSIAVIVLVQLNSALAPSLLIRKRPRSD
jgi:hypothetical protein